MVNKPGRRKQGGRGRTYLVAGIILVLMAASVSYAFVAGIGPFTKQSATTTSTTTDTSQSLLYARVNTSLGTFEVELFASLTPKTVANFVNLVNQGFYNNLVWHRIQPGFVIQTGDPTTRYGRGNRSTWGGSDSGVYIPFEYVPSLHNDEYYLGMASTKPGAGGSSQFYINLVNNSAGLDGKYAVFGKVINGYNVVQALGSVPVEQVAGQDEPVTPVYVTSIVMISGP